MYVTHYYISYLIYYVYVLLKSLGSERFIFLSLIYTFIQQGHITFIKRDSKDIYNVTKES